MRGHSWDMAMDAETDWLGKSCPLVINSRPGSIPGRAPMKNVTEIVKDIFFFIYVFLLCIAYLVSCLAPIVLALWFALLVITGIYQS